MRWPRPAPNAVGCPHWVKSVGIDPLLAIVETMRSLDLFKESTQSHYLNMTLSNKLQRLFEPPPPPSKPKRAYKKRRPKAGGQTAAAIR